MAKPQDLVACERFRPRALVRLQDDDRFRPRARLQRVYEGEDLTVGADREVIEEGQLDMFAVEVGSLCFEVYVA